MSRMKGQERPAGHCGHGRSLMNYNVWKLTKSEGEEINNPDSAPWD